MKKLSVILVTTTRADWGILSPLAAALSAHPAVNLTVAAGNMHLQQRYGHTIDNIVADGFENVVALPSPEADNTEASRTAIAAATMTGMASVIDRMHPDAVVLLGDRYEILGAASAALIAGVPIVHLHGGEVSEGAVDDSIRHAVSKMATLHLTATAKSARRLLQMGEEPQRVVNIGSIGVANAMSVDVMSRDELSRSLGGFDIDARRTLLVTYHPVTRDPDGASPAAQLDQLLLALEQSEDTNAIITYPNNDTGSDDIIARLEEFAGRHADRVCLVQSLGHRRYLSAMYHVCAVVGNTSSGLLEAPSTPAATIDIGPRQQGRERAASVIHVNACADDILQAIRTVTQAPRHNPQPADNPYYQPGPVDAAVRAITVLLPQLSVVKHFVTQPDE